MSKFQCPNCKHFTFGETFWDKGIGPGCAIVSLLAILGVFIPWLLQNIIIIPVIIIAIIFSVVSHYIRKGSPNIEYKCSNCDYKALVKNPDYKKKK